MGKALSPRASLREALGYDRIDPFGIGRNTPLCFMRSDMYGYIISFPLLKVLGLLVAAGIVAGVVAIMVFALSKPCKDEDDTR